MLRVLSTVPSLLARAAAGVSVVVLVLLAGTAHAQTLGGTLDATLTLTTSCLISGDTGETTSGADFGQLDFGSEAATFTGEVTATATNGAGGAGATEIICSPDVTEVTVGITGGLNAGEGSAIGTGARALSDGASSFVPYDVYSDSGHTNVYPANGAGVAVNVPVPGSAFALPIYGRINKTSTSALAVGTYTDTLTVTIEF